MLQTGFARVDITPPLGAFLEGYFRPRHAQGILDPLMATAVAFDNGTEKALIFSLDLIGIDQTLVTDLRAQIGAAAGMPMEAVFICCTHTHLAPGVCSHMGQKHNPDYIPFLTQKLIDAGVMAVNDIAPTEMLYTRGEVKDVAFLRRFRMKDGSVQTNPGRQNPDILHPVGKVDETSSLLILKREGKPEIGIVNFQVHPDVIGGEFLSADFPYFVRSTYEKTVPNSLCMYINGAQGNLNHIDVRLPKCPLSGGYGRSRYMGEKIAYSVIANRFLAQPLEGEEIGYIHRDLEVRFNKGTPEEVEESMPIYLRYQETGSASEALPGVTGMMLNALVGQANRIVRYSTMPDTFTLPMTALRVGSFALATLPGEPFNEIGSTIKEGSPYTLTMAACCANGYEGYLPTEEDFSEFSYETATARFQKETGTKMIRCSLELLNEIK